MAFHRHFWVISLSGCQRRRLLFWVGFQLGFLNFVLLLMKWRITNFQIFLENMVKSLLSLFESNTYVFFVLKEEVAQELSACLSNISLQGHALILINQERLKFINSIMHRNHSTPLIKPTRPSTSKSASTLSKLGLIQLPDSLPGLLQERMSIEGLLTLRICANLRLPIVRRYLEFKLKTPLIL